MILMILMTCAGDHEKRGLRNLGIKEIEAVLEAAESRISKDSIGKYESIRIEEKKKLRGEYRCAEASS